MLDTSMYILLLIVTAQSPTGFLFPPANPKVLKSSPDLRSVKGPGVAIGWRAISNASATPQKTLHATGKRIEGTAKGKREWRSSWEFVRRGVGRGVGRLHELLKRRIINLALRPRHGARIGRKLGRCQVFPLLGEGGE